MEEAAEDVSVVRTPAVRRLRAGIAVVLVGCFAAMAAMSLRWPLLADAQVMRYVNFLVDHGMSPYRDILDLNMPGTYFSDRLAVFLFGPSDLGWRVYDLFLMLLATGAMVVIAAPVDWLAGLFAGTLFALDHAADGPTAVGERDFFISVLMLGALAALLTATRRGQSRWVAGTGIFLGIAATVKPTTAPLGFVLLAMTAWMLHRRGAPWAATVLYGVAGAAAVAATFFGYLVGHHSLAAFIDVQRTVTPFYAGLHREPFGALVREMLPRSLRLLALVGIVAVVLNHRAVGSRWSWERWLPMASAAMGLFSFFLQGKGFAHHRYEFVACLLLWLAIELSLAAKRAGAPRLLAVAGVVVGLGYVAPVSLVRVKDSTFATLFRVTTTEEDDLRSLGLGRLQGKVQCLDMTDGCMNALYRVGLVQNTGVTGDLLYFSADNASPVVQRYREIFRQHLQVDPPDVFMVSNELFLDPPTFDKVNRWPAFAGFLAAHYTVVAEHRYDEKFSSRMYVRKDSAVGRGR